MSASNTRRSPSSRGSAPRSASNSRGARGLDDGRCRACGGAVRHRARDEARRLHQVKTRRWLPLSTSNWRATRPALTGGRLFPQRRRQGWRPGRRSSARSLLDAGGRAALHLDDRAAGDDDLFLAPALQPARSRAPASSGWRTTRYFLTDPAFLACAPEHAGPGRLGAAHHRRARHLAGAAARPAGVRPGIVRLMVIAPFFVMPTVSRAGLEEPVDASRYRAVRLASPSCRLDSRSTGSPTGRCSRSSSSSPGNGCRSRR